MLTLSKTVFFAFCSMLVSSNFISANTYTPLEYPSTECCDQIDNYFGYTVPDPYRWLEDSTSEKTQSWIKTQNDLTDAYLYEIPFRGRIQKRLKELLDYPRISLPFKAGEYYLFAKNDGFQNQSVVYIQKGLDGIPDVLLDPNTLSAEGTIAVTIKSVSKDHRYAAISLSESGSDWETIQIIDLVGRKFTEDKIENVKFSTIAWKGHGFYYPCYREKNDDQNNNSIVCYHTIGTLQTEDEIVFQEPHTSRFYSPQTIEDECLLVISVQKSASEGNALYIKDLSDQNSSFNTLIDNFDHTFSVIDVVGKKLITLTDNDAPNARIILIDLKNPSKAKWETIIPEGNDLLEYVELVGNKLLVCYLHNVANRIFQYDLSGNIERELVLPMLGNVPQITGDKDSNSLFYSFNSFTNPPTYFKYDITTGNTETWLQTPVKFDPEAFEIKQVWYSSKDGTKIPMFIVHRKDLDLSKTHPTLLYGYGGFQICIKPAYDPAKILFLESGGIYAVPALRGGGEFGETWHEAGKLLKKQNVFDDFIGAAEYLISEGYTSKDELAIHGRSNGGLLVGACMTQRPDLYKVCFPDVGVLDMLRFQHFTVGHHWRTEYGSSANKEEFQNLYRYSPLHNVREGVDYPATLIMTGDHDDRVVPAHSYKFIAALQQQSAKNNPLLIRVTTNAGHGSGKPISKLFEEQVDFWSFLLHHTSTL